MCVCERDAIDRETEESRERNSVHKKMNNEMQCAAAGVATHCHTLVYVWVLHLSLIMVGKTLQAIQIN